MTKFLQFINTLSHLPLSYLESCSADVHEYHHTQINLHTTSNKDVMNIFQPLLMQAKEGGTSRLELVEYVIDALCLWRQYAYDFQLFQQNRDMLEKTITEFFQTIQKLLVTTNSEDKRFTIQTVTGDGAFNILGLKPAWTSVRSRGNSAVVKFLKSIEQDYKKVEDISKIISNISTMLDDHESFMKAQIAPFLMIEATTPQVASSGSSNESEAKTKADLEEENVDPLLHTKGQSDKLDSPLATFSTFTPEKSPSDVKKAQKADEVRKETHSERVGVDRWIH